MNEDLKITKEDLVLWLDRPPSNDDLDLCSYLSNAVENQYKYYQENKILRENAEHNDKVVDKVNWENKHYKHIIDELEKWLKDIKEGIEELTIGFQEWGHPAKPSIVIDDVLNKLQELKGSDKE